MIILFIHNIYSTNNEFKRKLSISSEENVKNLNASKKNKFDEPDDNVIIKYDGKNKSCIPCDSSRKENPIRTITNSKITNYLKLLTCKIKLDDVNSSNDFPLNSKGVITIIDTKGYKNTIIQKSEELRNSLNDFDKILKCYSQNIKINQTREELEQSFKDLEGIIKLDLKNNHTITEEEFKQILKKLNELIKLDREDNFIERESSLESILNDLDEIIKLDLSNYSIQTQQEFLDELNEVKYPNLKIINPIQTKEELDQSLKELENVINLDAKKNVFIQNEAKFGQDLNELEVLISVGEEKYNRKIDEQKNNRKISNSNKMNKIEPNEVTKVEEGQSNEIEIISENVQNNTKVEEGQSNEIEIISENVQDKTKIVFMIRNPVLILNVPIISVNSLNQNL